MAAKKTLRLSAGFVQETRRQIAWYFLKHPHLLLTENITLFVKWIFHVPFRRKGWFPKNYFGALEGQLNHFVFAKLTLIAQIIRRAQGPDSEIESVIFDGIGNGLYQLGAEGIAEPFQMIFVDSFPLAAVLPDFFDRLYAELVRINGKDTGRFWRIEHNADGLFVCVPEKNLREPKRPARPPFKKTRSV